MPFSIRYGLTCGCLTMLSFILVQVFAGPAPNCCMGASKGTFNKPVNACFRLKKNPYRGCVSTYVFRTEKEDLCVDPEAWWIPRRLKRLEQRGIHCHTL